MKKIGLFFKADFFKKRGNKLKAQISTEYMVIVGFVILILTPTLLIYYSYTRGMSDEVVSGQVNKIAQKVIDAAESVYYLGEPSQTTIKAYTPGSIVSVNVSDNEIVYKVRISSGVTDIVQVSPINLTGSLPKTPGIHFITVKSIGEKVNLSYN